MLRWSLTFFIVAIVAGALGMTGVAGTAVGIAKVLFFIAIGLFFVTLIAGLVAGNSITRRMNKTKSRDDHLIHH